QLLVNDVFLYGIRHVLNKPTKVHIVYREGCHVHDKTLLFFVCDELGPKEFGIAVDKIAELSKNCQPDIVWAKNEMEILIKRSNYSLDEGVGVRNDCFAVERPERRPHYLPLLGASLSVRF